MNGTKFIFIALIILFAGASLPSPEIFAGTAATAPGWVDNVSAVQVQYNSNDYGRVQIRDNGYTRYESPPPGCNTCAVRDCDSCTRGPYVSGFHCDLWGCAWLREYGCPTCPVM
jgi:hypothetical protein